MTAFVSKQILDEHQFAINCLAFSPCGRFLASGSDDGFMKVWAVSTGSLQYEVSLESAVLSVLWHPVNLETILCGTVEGRLFHCLRLTKEIQDGRDIDIGVAGAVHCLAYSLELKALAIAYGNEVYIVKEPFQGSIGSMKMPTVADSAIPKPTRPRSIHFAEGGRILIVSFLYHGIRAWDTLTRDALWIIAPTDERSRIGSSALSPDSQFLLVHNISHGIDLVSLGGSKQNIRSFPHESLADSSYPVCVAFLDDGQVAVSGSSKGAVYVWDLKAKTKFQDLEHGDHVVQAIAVFQGDTLNYIAAGTSTQGKKPFIKIWQCTRSSQKQPSSGNDPLIRLLIAYSNKDIYQLMYSSGLILCLIFATSLSLYIIVVYPPWAYIADLTNTSTFTFAQVFHRSVTSLYHCAVSVGVQILRLFLWIGNRTYRVVKRMAADYEEYTNPPGQ